MSTSIEWTDETWNPTRGCSRVSEGCRNCYAEAIAARFSKPGNTFHGFAERTVDGPRWTGDVVLLPDRLDQPLRWRAPRRVFVNSMSDLFHENLTAESIARVFAVMAFARQHTFQVLTKRAERMRQVLNDPLFRDEVEVWITMMLEDEDRPAALRWDALDRRTDDARATAPDVGGDYWPLPNVWLGVSVENQHFADERIPLLLQTPAAVRFISAEPLLEHVDLRTLNVGGGCDWDCLGGGSRRYGAGGRQVCYPYDSGPIPSRLDWVIVGGESGHGARTFDVAWGRALVAQCRSAGVPVFVKQLGALPLIGRYQPGVFIPDYELHLKSKKGGDMSEWPSDLRVREYPAVPV